ncbi:hypothetical protein QOT17_022784 [Balamuthia mandrillaris]
MQKEDEDLQRTRSRSSSFPSAHPPELLLSLPQESSSSSSSINSACTNSSSSPRSPRLLFPKGKSKTKAKAKAASEIRFRPSPSISAASATTSNDKKKDKKKEKEAELTALSEGPPRRRKRANTDNAGLEKPAGVIFEPKRTGSADTMTRKPSKGKSKSNKSSSRELSDDEEPSSSPSSPSSLSSSPASSFGRGKKNRHNANSHPVRSSAGKASRKAVLPPKKKVAGSWHGAPKLNLSKAQEVESSSKLSPRRKASDALKRSFSFQKIRNKKEEKSRLEKQLEKLSELERLDMQYQLSWKKFELEKQKRVERKHSYQKNDSGSSSEEEGERVKERKGKVKGREEKHEEHDASWTNQLKKKEKKTKMGMQLGGSLAFIPEEANGVMCVVSSEWVLNDSDAETSTKLEKELTPRKMARSNKSIVGEEEAEEEVDQHDADDDDAVMKELRALELEIEESREKRPIRRSTFRKSEENKPKINDAQRRRFQKELRKAKEKMNREEEEEQLRSTKKEKRRSAEVTSSERGGSWIKRFGGVKDDKKEKKSDKKLKKSKRGSSSARNSPHEAKRKHDKEQEKESPQSLNDATSTTSEESIPRTDSMEGWDLEGPSASFPSKKTPPLVSSFVNLDDELVIEDSNTDEEQSEQNKKMEANKKSDDAAKDFFCLDDECETGTEGYISTLEEEDEDDESERERSNKSGRILLFTESQRCVSIQATDSRDDLRAQILEARSNKDILASPNSAD